MMILLVTFEMIVQIIESPRQKGNLHLRRPGISVVSFVISNQFNFYFFC